MADVQAGKQIESVDDATATADPAGHFAYYLSPARQGVAEHGITMPLDKYLQAAALNSQAKKVMEDFQATSSAAARGGGGGMSADAAAIAQQYKAGTITREEAAAKLKALGYQ